MRAILWAMVMLMTTAAWGQQAERVKDLGVQITSSTMQGTSFTRDAQGRDLVFTAMRGEPARLLGFDVATGELVTNLPLEGAQGAWAVVTASDGSVYVGSQSNGSLYRYVPGDKDLTNLGQVLPGQTFVWDLAAGPDGAVFGATYPGCQVFRYHPGDGFADVGGGAVAEDELYARGVAYDASSGKVYVGVGAHAHLIELDPATGAKRNILPEKFAEKKFVYAVAVEAGRVFGQITDGSHLLVMNQQTQEIEALLPQVDSRLISPKSPYDDVVYFTAGGTLYAYNLKTRQQSEVDVKLAANIQTFTWKQVAELGDGPALVGFVRTGQIFKYHPRTGKSVSIKLEAPGEPTPIQSIVLGPDGRIYSGGYLSGGLSAYDPRTGKSEQLGSISQPEGITTIGPRMYLGLYPRARINVFDTSRPWGRGNPQQLFLLDEHDQDRPFGMLGVESMNKLFIGTVSDYGTLGGALTVYDENSGEHVVHRHIVPDQSIVSLAHHNGQIIAGSSIFGGLGIKPKAKEAVLFIWDEQQKKKLFETVPVPGALAITSLINAPDGTIWGMGNDVIFTFDPESRQVTFKKSLFNFDYSGQGHLWRGAAITWHPSGQIYGTVRGRLFRFDPQSHELEVLHDGGAQLIAQDRDGRIYFSHRSHLYQYTPEGVEVGIE